MKSGSTEIIAQSRGTRADTIPPQIREVPGGLYPLHSAAFEMDEYRLMAGWPVPVPAYDIRTDTMMTADGTVLADREHAHLGGHRGHLRWVADDSYYDRPRCAGPRSRAGSRRGPRCRAPTRPWS